MALTGVQTQSLTSSFVPSDKVNGFSAARRVLSIATDD